MCSNPLRLWDTLIQYCVWCASRLLGSTVCLPMEVFDRQFLWSMRRDIVLKKMLKNLSLLCVNIDVKMVHVST